MGEHTQNAQWSLKGNPFHISSSTRKAPLGPFGGGAGSSVVEGTFWGTAGGGGGGAMVGVEDMVSYR